MSREKRTHTLELKAHKVRVKQLRSLFLRVFCHILLPKVAR